MDFELYHKYPPGDPILVDKIVCHLKAQGIFDNFRKECLSDVDTKPAYQNLRQRVDGSVAGYLAGHKWKPDLNKNQLRESLRKYIQNGGFLEVGVERIVDQVVNPKIGQVFLPRVRDVVFEGLGLKEENNSNVSDRPASTSYMPPSSSTYTTASIPNQIEVSKENAALEKEPMSAGDCGVKKEDDESEIIQDNEEIVTLEMELEPVIKTEEATNHLETQTESRSNDSFDSRISGISDLTSVKSTNSSKDLNASDDDNNFGKSVNTDDDGQKEDQGDEDNIDKSMPSVNGDDVEDSQDKIQQPSNDNYEKSYTNFSFLSEFTTQVESVEIDTDQIGTSVVECVTTSENNEEDGNGRDITKNIELNYDSDSNEKYRKEIELQQSTDIEYEYNDDNNDEDENTYDEISRGLNSDHKEGSHFEETQSETDVERFDSTSNEMKFSENTNCFDDETLQKSSDDESSERHKYKVKEELARTLETERNYRKEKERKHHSKHKHSKDYHYNSSSGESREDRKHRKSSHLKDKPLHMRDDDSHSSSVEDKSRKTYDSLDKHRRSKRGEESMFDQEETSKSESDEKNIHYKERHSRSWDHKRATKEKTHGDEYEETTFDQEEVSKSESNEKNKYKERPRRSREHKHVTEENANDEDEEANKSESDEKIKYQEKVAYSHKEKHSRSRDHKKASKEKDVDIYEETNTCDQEEAGKDESDEKNKYHNERPTRLRKHTHVSEENSNYEGDEASKSESDEKMKNYHKGKHSRSKDHKKTHGDEYEETAFVQEEASKNESEVNYKYQEKVEYFYKEKHSGRSRADKNVSKEKCHDNDDKYIKEEHQHRRSNPDRKKNDSSSKHKHSANQNDVKEDRSHKSSTREHRSSHHRSNRDNRDKHEEKELKNYGEGEKKLGVKNDDKERRKDKDKSKKNRDNCKPADKSRVHRRSADGDSSGTGDSRGLGSAASSGVTRSERSQNKEKSGPRSGGKGSSSSTSDAISTSVMLEDSQDYFEQNYVDETVIIFPTIDSIMDGNVVCHVQNGVSNNENNLKSNKVCVSRGDEDTQIFQEKREEGEKVDCDGPKEQEKEKYDMEKLGNNNEMKITLESERLQTSSNELGFQEVSEHPTISALTNLQENLDSSEKMENFEGQEKLNLNDQVEEKDFDVLVSDADAKEYGESNSLHENEAIFPANVNLETVVPTQNVETQLPLNEFRKKRFAANIAEVRKIMRERRRNERIQKKRLRLNDSVANDHSSMKDQKVDNQTAMDKNRLVETDNQVENSHECNKLISAMMLNESSVEVRAECTDEIVQNQDDPPASENNVNNFKYKRPKFAANIYEVRKIIKARRRLRRMEKKRFNTAKRDELNRSTAEYESKAYIEENEPNSFRDTCQNKHDDGSLESIPTNTRSQLERRVAKIVLNKLECDSTDNKTEKKTENLITLKIESQDCVESGSENFECKSSLSYQDINQLASKCLLVKIKKLDEDNSMKVANEISSNTKALNLSDDLEKSMIQDNNNENIVQIDNNCDTIEDCSSSITNGRKTSEDELNDLEVKQVKEADLSTHECQLENEVSSSANPITTQDENSHLYKDSKRSDEVLIYANPCPSSDDIKVTKVENSSTLETTCLADDVTVSSCEESEYDDNTPDVGTPETITKVDKITENHSSEKSKLAEDVGSFDTLETINSVDYIAGSEKPKSFEKVESLDSSETINKAVDMTESKKSKSFEKIECLNSSETINSVDDVTESEKSKSFEEVESSDSSETNNKVDHITEREKSKSVEELDNFDTSETIIKVDGITEIHSSERLKSAEEVTEGENLSSLKTIGLDVDLSESHTCEQSTSFNSPEVESSSLTKLIEFQDNGIEIRSRGGSKSPVQALKYCEIIAANKNFENENNDHIEFLNKDSSINDGFYYFEQNETDNSVEKLTKFKLFLNTYEKDYKYMKDIEKTDLVTSDFALDRKFDSYLEKECGFQVLRKDCILLPSLNDENYYFDKERSCYYLKNRLVDSCQMSKENHDVRLQKTSGKNRNVLRSDQNSECVEEKQSIRGKSIFREQRKSPVKLRISIRNPNSSVIETEEINVPYTSDVESSTDGSAGRISIDSRKSVEENEPNHCNEPVRVSTPLHDDKPFIIAESETVQLISGEVTQSENSFKNIKKKRGHSRRKRSSNSTHTETCHQDFKIKNSPENENNNLPSAEGAAHLSSFKITFSRNNSNLPRVIAPQSPSSQSNNLLVNKVLSSADAAVPSESESRLVVGKRHCSKTDSFDDSVRPPKKKCDSAFSDTDFKNMDQAIETVTDSLNNSFEDEADVSLDENMTSNMIGEALKNLIAESGLVTTTSQTSGYHETKVPARVTRQQRNQKMSNEPEDTVSPPKKIRNSERLSAGVKLPRRYENTDFYKPRLDHGQDNRRKRKPDEPVLDSLVDNEPPKKRKLSNVVGSARRRSR